MIHAAAGSAGTRPSLGGTSAVRSPRRSPRHPAIPLSRQSDPPRQGMPSGRLRHNTALLASQMLDYAGFGTQMLASDRFGSKRNWKDRKRTKENRGEQCPNQKPLTSVRQAQPRHVGLPARHVTTGSRDRARRRGTWMLAAGRLSALRRRRLALGGALSKSLPFGRLHPAAGTDNAE